VVKKGALLIMALIFLKKLKIVLLLVLYFQGHDVVSAQITEDIYYILI